MRARVEKVDILGWNQSELVVAIIKLVVLPVPIFFVQSGGWLVFEAVWIVIVGEDIL